MEQTRNPPAVADVGDSAAVPVDRSGIQCLARISDRLTPPLIEAAVAVNPHRHPSRAVRVDGWTPQRIRIFLNALAECGVVTDAARAAGMSGTSAYNLRNRTASRAFHLAWAAAERLARGRLAAELMSRALHGCAEIIVRNGEVWAERHRYDNRLTMAVLKRLDQQAEADDSENRTVAIVAREFDQFLDIVCQGGKGAVEFFAARADDDGETHGPPETWLLERAENYGRYAVGLGSEVTGAGLDQEGEADGDPPREGRPRRITTALARLRRWSNWPAPEDELDDE